MNQRLISVLIVEDQEIMRFGLKKSLQQLNKTKVVGEAASGLDAVAKARVLQPDVILMDIGLPELNGIEATRMIKKELPNVRVIMLTSFDDAERTCASLAAGADGYCVKNIPVHQLASVIETVHDGFAWLDPQIAGHVLKIHSVNDDQSQKKSASAATEIQEIVPEGDDEDLECLTKRELQILHHLMNGPADADLAARLGVTESTIKGHVRRILQKLARDEKTQKYLAYMHPGLV